MSETVPGTERDNTEFYVGKKSRNRPNSRKAVILPSDAKLISDLDSADSTISSPSDKPPPLPNKPFIPAQPRHHNQHSGGAPAYATVARRRGNTNSNSNSNSNSKVRAMVHNINSSSPTVPHSQHAQSPSPSHSYYPSHSQSNLSASTSSLPAASQSPSSSSSSSYSPRSKSNTISNPSGLAKSLSSSHISQPSSEESPTAPTAPTASPHAWVARPISSGHKSNGSTPSPSLASKPPPALQIVPQPSATPKTSAIQIIPPRSSSPTFGASGLTNLPDSSILASSAPVTSPLHSSTSSKSSTTSTPTAYESPVSEPAGSPQVLSPTLQEVNETNVKGEAATTGSGGGGGGGGGGKRFFTLRRGANQQQSNNQASDLHTEYENYLAIAKREVFNDVAPLNFLYQSGNDSAGRPIIVMIGAHLPAKKIDLERVMLYAIRVMDAVVESEYVLVYAHTNISSENRPNFAWLRKMYTIFNRKYKKNLKQLYIVHPTVWIKMTFRLFKPFLSNKFWKKLIYIENSADIWKYFQKDQIKLPDKVINYGAPPRKAQPMFGTSLDELVARPENNANNPSDSPREIPKLIEDAVKYLREKALDVEGIFRISGSSSTLKELKKSFDAGEDIDFSEIEDPHVVAGILKLYLRELPLPILVNCHTSLLNCHLLPSLQQQIECLKMIIASLPRVHKATAKHLITFFHEVTLRAAENRMPPQNLAIVTAPNIVKDPHETMESAIQDTPAINSAVAILIEHADKIL